MSVPVPDDADTPISLGHPGGHEPTWHHDRGPGYRARGYEENPDLQFPHSIAVYDLMRKTDGQVGSLLRAIIQALLGTRFTLHTDDINPAVAKVVETELGLDRVGDGKISPRTQRKGIVWTEHLRELLLSVPLGFMPFVPMWQVGPPTREQTGTEGMPDLVAHLTSLSPRLPRTLNEVRVTRGGDLAGILQAGVGWDTTGQNDGVHVIGGPNTDDTVEVWIDRHNLAYYCFEREGADWTGSSILRSAYKHWLIKDELIRTDAMAGERNGLGVPAVYYTDRGNREEALRIAEAYRAGATAGLALEDGAYKVEIMGVTGQVRDILPSIEYHDRQVGQSALAMFLNLGHDGGLGHGAIGDTFLDLFVDSLNGTGDWAAETVTEEVIAKIVLNTFGPDEPYPVLTCDGVAAESTPTAEALKTLVDAGLVAVDDDLRKDVRRRYKLPAEQDVRVVAQAGSNVSQEDLEPQADAIGDTVREVVDSDPLLTRAAALVKRIEDLHGAGV